HDNTRRNVAFAVLPGRFIEQVIPDAAWERFFIFYSPNAWGQYYPGNEVAMYSLDEGLLWFMAGDDLPPSDARSYGWVDDETVYIYGDGVPEAQPGRVYGLEYDDSGLPLCAVQAFPDQLDLW